jgi:predicted negative regulator of RcsB-dependent stress response
MAGRRITPLMQSDAAQLTMQDRLLAWFENNKQAVIRFGVSAVIVGFVAGFWFWRHNARETTANAALSQILGGSRTGNAPADNTAALLKLSADFPKTPAAERALLIAAGDLFAAGKYPEARSQFDAFLRDYGSSAYSVQALFGIAACLDAQGKTDEAIAAYKSIVEHHQGENVALQSKLALGRLYETRNKLELARDQYMELVHSGASGIVANEAGMRLEELISTHPALAPAKPAAANSSAPALVKP